MGTSFQLDLKNGSLCSLKQKLVAFTLLLTLAVTSGQSDQPNIVFIMADDLGFNDVGYHGYGEIMTPNIDALARDGVRLENYYVAPLCGPTRTQFLTGRYSIHLGLQGSNLAECTKEGVPLEYRTIANEMKDRGYATHMIGKWHGGFHKKEYFPTNRGFDTYRGYLLRQSSSYYTREMVYTTGIEYMDYRNNEDTYHGDLGEYTTTAFTRRAQELITDHNTTQPMFLYLAYQAPHYPLEAPTSYVNMYMSSIPIKERRLYAAMVTALDDGVGQVVQTLKDAGIYNNTVIILSADNGGLAPFASNYPLKGSKGEFYQGGVRAVGLVSSPLIKASKRNRNVTSLMHITDWLPTLVNIAGDNTSIEVDGFNQWDVIKEGTDSQRQEVLHNIVQRERINATEFSLDTQAAIVNKDGWKLMTGVNRGGVNIPNPKDNYTEWFKIGATSVEEYAERDGELYNILTDPTEQINQFKNPKYASIKEGLLDDLLRYQNTVLDAIPMTVYQQCNPALNGGVWGPWAQKN
ncbi:ARSJ [Bugula neritina]|uniref:ARSJ n=1 Tax=Bugula neritina TaxID=10212 RepID=A0A7J7JXH1_BUGNE|nr:ARSJ [Bugula neritina]